MKFISTLGLLLAVAALTYGCVVSVVPEKTPRPSHSEVPYCFTGIIWNEGTPDEMGLFWPCASMHEIQGVPRDLLERDA